MNRIKEKKREIREEMMQKTLLDSALKLLIERGWEGITMGRVASESGVSKGTIYNYFKDKEDLMKHLMDDLSEPYLKAMKNIAESDCTASEKIEKMIDYALFDLFKHRKLIKAIMEVHLKSKNSLKIEKLRSPELVPTKICNMFRSMVEDGLASGEFNSINAEGAAMLIQGGLMNAMRWVSLFDGPFRLEDLQNTFKTIVFKGLVKRRVNE